MLEHLITDLRSCEAVIKTLQVQEPGLEAIRIHYLVWLKIIEVVSPTPNPYAYYSRDDHGHRVLTVRGITVYSKG